MANGKWQKITGDMGMRMGMWMRMRMRSEGSFRRMVSWMRHGGRAAGELVIGNINPICPSSFIVHPSSFILHRSSFILHRSGVFVVLCCVVLCCAVSYIVLCWTLNVKHYPIHFDNDFRRTLQFVNNNIVSLAS
jgi:hypothetical protein